MNDTLQSYLQDLKHDYYGRSNPRFQIDTKQSRFEKFKQIPLEYIPGYIIIYLINIELTTFSLWINNDTLSRIYYYDSIGILKKYFNGDYDEYRYLCCRNFGDPEPIDDPYDESCLSCYNDREEDFYQLLQYYMYKYHKDKNENELIKNLKFCLKYPVKNNKYMNEELDKEYSWFKDHLSLITQQRKQKIKKIINFFEKYTSAQYVTRKPTVDTPTLFNLCNGGVSDIYLTANNK